MRAFQLPKLYPLTDRRLSGLTHAEQVTRLCAGGATFIQLREKHLAPREFYAEAVEALRVARAQGAQLIINDRTDIALALGADGVHLGQDDLDSAAARSLLGPKALIGFSTHTVAQAVTAAQMPLDYLAIGPIFSTATKENPDPVIGLDGLRRAREAIGALPLVAIGGITLDNAPAVLAAGADSVAVIGALMGGDPAGLTLRIRNFLAVL